MRDGSKYIIGILVAATAVTFAAVTFTGAAVARAGRENPAVPHRRALMLAAAPRSAQAPQQTEGGEPQRTSATYDDWIVQCVIRSGPPQKKGCDMVQVVRRKNKPVALVIMTKPVQGRPMELIVQLPVNVSLASGVRIQTAAADPGVRAPFVHCLPGGCVAMVALKQDTIERFRAAHGSGKMLFADAVGRTIAIPLSFKGFDEALSALERE